MTLQELHLELEAMTNQELVGIRDDCVGYLPDGNGLPETPSEWAATKLLHMVVGILNQRS